MLGPASRNGRRSRATAANVYLMLYPRGDMRAALEARPDLYPVVFSHLQSLGGAHLIREGRVYGGGLHKLEPKELANLPAAEIARSCGSLTMPTPGCYPE